MYLPRRELQPVVWAPRWQVSVHAECCQVARKIGGQEVEVGGGRKKRVDVVMSIIIMTNPVVFSWRLPLNTKFGRMHKTSSKQKKLLAKLCLWPSLPEVLPSAENKRTRRN